MAKEYNNLETVSGGLVGWGLVFKICAVITAFAGCRYGLQEHWGGKIITVLSLGGGIIIWGFGLLLAAAGEALGALRDLAVNSERTATALTSTTKDVGSVPVHWVATKSG